MRLSFVLPGRQALAEGDFPATQGLTVWEAARRLGAPLTIPCGGQGLCGKCAVRVEPAPPPTPDEERLLDAGQLAAGVRLACRCRPSTDTVVRREGIAVAPATAGLFPERVEVEAGQTGLGVAIDLGTTTLAAGCVDLGSGAVLATAQAANPQARYGDDVLARLGYALKGAAAREELRRVILEGLNRLLGEVAAGAGVGLAQVGRAVVVGNPAMHHLLLGLEVASLARAPHRPASVEVRQPPAGTVGLALGEGVPVYLPPLVDGFVGADAVAVALAEGLLLGRPAPDPRLALDLGTNGELVLATPAGVYACSTAAGPAFEGAGLRCGMRAGPGAVVTVEPGTPLTVHTLGGAPARGLAGSGALGTAATLLALGALAPNGRLRAAAELPEPPWPGLAERLITLADGQRAVVLVPGEETATGEPVLLTQTDLRQLQLAKGAVRAAVEVLFRRSGVRAGDLHAILFAGAFGHGLAAESALATGLIPPVPAARLRAVGHAAWRGAALLLGNPSLRPRVEWAARRLGHLALADDPDFPALYLAALDFPALAGVVE